MLSYWNTIPPLRIFFQRRSFLYVPNLSSKHDDLQPLIQHFTKFESEMSLFLGGHPVHVVYMVYSATI